MTVSFFTFGCKVNTAETQNLKWSFENNGFSVILGESADVFIINTCTVTHVAVRKCRNILRRLRRENPHSVILMAGCMPQTEKAAENLGEADIILGNSEKPHALSYVLEFLKNGKRIYAVSDIFQEEKFKPLEISRFDESFQRAYLKIEDGCDCFCAYCAIGFARGRVRS
ncbi:MAG: tRNA (N(6)-L-threonylcarbamoyladenosine(37)-C(2))-methylthiotransferase MtaB, partial [Oscillospiraceae bacterium]